MENFNEILHKITQYIPNEKIKFRKHPYTDNLEIIFENHLSIMTVLKNNTWEEIKRHIDKIMEPNSTRAGDCAICFMPKKHDVSCAKCSNTHCSDCSDCSDCYINIFRTNKGIIRCPFCNHTVGQCQI